MRGEVLLDGICCSGLAIDYQRYLYVSHCEEHEVRRYSITGGNGNGSALNQLNGPLSIFVDRQQAVYVSDCYNHRVMKWDKDKEKALSSLVVKATGSSLTQLSCPLGLFVDTLGTVYVQIHLIIA